MYVLNISRILTVDILVFIADIAGFDLNSSITTYGVMLTDILGIVEILVILLSHSKAYPLTVEAILLLDPFVAV